MKTALLIFLLTFGLCSPSISTSQESPSKKTDDKHPVVIIKTNMGIIEITLNAEKAPITVENFLSYVEESFYDSTLFHRVIKGFMIQGGGFTTNMAKKATKPPIKNEGKNGLSNLRGTIAMARMNAVHSATSQFFINHVDNKPLDNMQEYGYAVFGKVTKGMDVVDRIAAVKTGSQNMPVKQVVIESVRAKE